MLPLRMLLLITGYLHIPSPTVSAYGRKVVIAGGAVSGLSAANHLCKNGICDITVLEAEDRVGGRLYTDRFKGDIVERGAQWMHGTRGNPVYWMVSRNHTVINDQTVDTKTGFIKLSSGDSPDPAVAQLIPLAWEIWDDLGEQLATLERPSTEKNKVVLDDAKELWEAKLNSRNITMKKTVTDAVFRYITIQWSMEEGERMQNVGILAALYYHYKGDDYLVPEGYSVFLNMLQKAIPKSAIKLGRKVTKISWNLAKEEQNSSDPQVMVEYTDRDGRAKQVNTDHVIVTPSIGVLQKYHQGMFVPSLSKQRVRALDTLRLGVVNKIFMYYKKPFWNDSDFPMWFVFDADIQEEFKEDAHWYNEISEIDAYTENILVVWANAYVSREVFDLPNETIGKKVTFLFRKFMSNDYDSIPFPDDVLVTRWHKMENFLGSYSYISPGQTKVTKRIAFRPLMVNGVPKVCFAGEASHLTRYGTIDGTYRAGVREASRIINLKST